VFFAQKAFKFVYCINHWQLPIVLENGNQDIPP